MEGGVEDDILVAPIALAAVAFGNIGAGVFLLAAPRFTLLRHTHVRSYTARQISRRGWLFGLGHKHWNGGSASITSRQIILQPLPLDRTGSLLVLFGVLWMLYAPYALH